MMDQKKGQYLEWKEEYLKCECIEKYKHINAGESAIKSANRLITSF